jgi:hypothetical protein
MSSVFSVVLLIHIIFGGIALFVAPCAMLTRKGGLWHRRWGKTYFWSMAVVALTAVLMSMMRSGLFFLLVALFSFYLALSGYRVLHHKTPQQRAGTADWFAAALMLVGGVVLAGYGAYLMLTSNFGTVAIVFGIIGILLAAADIHNFVRPPKDKRAWWYTHMTRMLAAYVATVTAFSVVNFQFLPVIARWLWATVIGTLGIVMWTRYYRKKFNGIGGQNNTSASRSVTKPV